jgi:hypothetical protein
MSNNDTLILKTGTLSEAHLQMLHQSAISDQVIAERGYRTVTDANELELLGFASAQRQVPGLLLPLHGVDRKNGIYVFRPDNPRVVEEKRKGKNSDGTYPCKVFKYEYPKGAPMKVDCPPLCQSQLANPKVRLWITEGQKKADALASIGECAIALLGVWNFKGKNENGGTTFLTDFDYIAWDQREVRIVFDSDVAVKPQVHQALDRLRHHLERHKARVSVVYLPTAPGGAKQGVDDFLAAGNTLEQLLAFSEKPREENEKTTVKRPSAAAMLIQFGLRAELFHSSDGSAFASVKLGNHIETMPLRSQKFKQWLAYGLHLEMGDPPSASAMQDAITVLEAHAVFVGPERPVFLRVGSQDDSIWIDLADDQHRAVQITSTGWTIVESPQVKFRRMRGMLPLPVPMRGATIDELRKRVNIGSDEDWIVAASWLVATLKSHGPYPILVVNGEQGSAKSTFCQVFRSLIDPNVASLRAEPRELRDLIIAATNGWIVALDNLSSVPVWLSDALCRLSTGGGFATRQLYTDGEEILFQVQRPILLNGIGAIATRGDLLDRSIILQLPGMPEEKRMAEEEFWTVFEQARPRILGALLDAVVIALRDYSQVKATRLPRMADFAKWSMAAAPAFGWRAQEFIQVYGGKRDEAYELTLEASPITTPLRTLLTKGAWKGTATELLDELNARTDEKTQRQPTYPKSPLTLSNLLRRLAPAFRNVGVAMEFDRKTHGRREIEIQEVGKRASPASPSSPDSETKEKHSNSEEKMAESFDSSAEEVTLGDARGSLGDAQVTLPVTLKMLDLPCGDAGDAEIPSSFSDDEEIVEWSG